MWPVFIGLLGKNNGADQSVQMRMPICAFDARIPRLMISYQNKSQYAVLTIETEPGPRGQI